MSATSTPCVTTSINATVLAEARAAAGLQNATAAAVVRHAIALLAGRNPADVEAMLRPTGRPRGSRNRPKTQTATTVAA